MIILDSEFEHSTTDGLYQSRERNDDLVALFRPPRVQSVKENETKKKKKNEERNRVGS